MSFDENAFIIAGTAIAIAGVGLYIWDTRKDSVINTYNQYRLAGQTEQAGQTGQTGQAGGSKRYRKKMHKKTRKHNYTNQK